jgi:DNA-directed RNA polymerase subunit RPC12/RpoP
LKEGQSTQEVELKSQKLNDEFIEQSESAKAINSEVYNHFDILVDCQINKSPVLTELEDDLNYLQLNNKLSTQTENESAKNEDFVCEICGKHFSKQNSLKKHNKFHTDPKTYECSKCNKVFKQLQTLNDHMRRHYDNRKYVCDLCGKRFYKHFNVVEHMRIHTGERPFKCEYCERTFTRALLLRNHIKKVPTFISQVNKCSGLNFLCGSVFFLSTWEND